MLLAEVDAISFFSVACCESVVLVVKMTKVRLLRKPTTIRLGDEPEIGPGHTKVLAGR
jgi:hypothetical protein